MPDHLPKTRPMAIAPSILTADLLHLGDEIERAERAGVDSIHLDVIDGVFAPNLTIGVPVVAAVASATSLPVEVHLMIVNPERYVEQFAEAGAQLITIHVEASPHLHRTVQQIHDTGARAGVALNPATPLVTIEEIIPFADLILVMTVNPGFGGQTFIPSMLKKVERLRVLLDEQQSPTLIEVDGGVKASNIRRLSRAGADAAVVGSGVFNQEQSVEEAMQALRAALR